MTNVIGIVFSIGLIVLAILAIIGLIFLTPVAFGSKNYDQLSQTQKNLMRLFIILIWISVVFSILSAIVMIATGKNRNN